MSLLAPLYFLGALAVGLPILFHLIRRQPKGQVEFSSLMFLRPTPPRLTRRSRLDNWLLLLLRGLALMLLAAAFARPFVRSVALSDPELPGRRIVMMVDTSASMQRTGLWEQALTQASEVLGELQPADSLAVITFDSEPRIGLSFEQSRQQDLQQVRAAAQQVLRDSKPSWHHTDLGRAISFAGDLAVTQEPEQKSEAEGDDGEDSLESLTPAAIGPLPAHLIVITDLQSGAEIESLQSYAWPKELRLEVRRVAPSKRTNASAQILMAAAEDVEEDNAGDRVRVRVANASDSEASRFSLAWTGDAKLDAPASGASGGSQAFETQVPPGQTRVVRMSVAPPGTQALTLQGDEHSFDNLRYVVTPEPIAMQVWYFGNETAEPRESLLYYLQRVPLQTFSQQVSIQTMQEAAITSPPNPREVPLVIVSRQLQADATLMLRQYIELGGRVLAVLPDSDAAGITQAINSVAASQIEVAEAEVDDYVMLTRIDFASRLFRAMADPQFNDFSKIRFWSHRRLSNLDDSWRVLARFDDGDPAILERTIGQGELLVMATGWQPQAGQLALSTKFIPLVYSLLNLSPGDQQVNDYIIGEAIPFPPSATATLTSPSGMESEFRSASDIDVISQPGIYTFRDGDQTRSFAVNLRDSESRTDPMDEGDLERFGIVIGKTISAEQTLENQRQLRDRELESQQKLWQWLLVVALVILGVETLLSGLWSRRQPVESVSASV